MAGTVNKVILVGHLGADPEIRAMGNGGKVAQLRIATSDTWRDKDTGDRKEKTEWHTVAIFSEGLVKVAEQYLKKGAKVYVEGQLATRKWTAQDGSDRYSTSIHLKSFGHSLVMLDGNRGDRPPHAADMPDGDAPGASERRAPAPSNDMDDDIPF